MSAAGRLDPPLDALAAWHRRGERLFATMRRLAAATPEAAANRTAREDAEAVMAYFDRSIAVHHPCEEQDLFPELIEAMAGSDPVCLREMIAGVTDEHRALAAAWRRLRPAFGALAAGAPAVLLPADIEALVARCERLFAREDDELLPMADRLLDDQARERIGAALRARAAGASPG